MSPWLSAAAPGRAQDARGHSGTNPTAPVRPEHGAAVERISAAAAPPLSGGPATGLGIAGMAGKPGAGSSRDIYSQYHAVSTGAPDTTAPGRGGS